MSITHTELTSRIDDELALLGSFTSATKTNILKDALTELCRLGDPVISATLAVVDGTQQYAYPATIKKISAIYDTATPPVEVVYTDQGYYRRVYLQEDPDESANYVVYGTPYNVRANYQTIIAGLDEELVGVLWQFIRAHAMQQAVDDGWAAEAQIARRMLKEQRQSQNRNDDVINQTIQILDRNGYRTDDVLNAEGLDPDYSDHLGIDVG